MRFRDIPQFPRCDYHIDVEWTYLEQYLTSQTQVGCGATLDLNPDFQRAHVWTQAQQIAYVEYILRGGPSGRALYFNCAGWMDDFRGPHVIVDGKQRLEAVRRFLRDDLPAFGSRRSEYRDHLRRANAGFSWNMAALETRAEVLRWYLDFNTGGSVHTTEELARVERLLKAETIAHHTGTWVPVENRG